MEQPGVTGITQDDQVLNRAIQESLTANYTDFASETYLHLPLESSIRKDDRYVLLFLIEPHLHVNVKRPVALRPSKATLVYAALVLQSLFFVPQIKEALASWRPSSSESDEEYITPPTSGEGQSIAVSCISLSHIIRQNIWCGPYRRRL